MDAESLQGFNKNPKKYMEQTSLRVTKYIRKPTPVSESPLSWKRKKLGEYSLAASRTLAFFLRTCLMAAFTAKQKKILWCDTQYGYYYIYMKKNQKKQSFLTVNLQLDQFTVVQLQSQLCWQKRVAFSRSAR